MSDWIVFAIYYCLLPCLCFYFLCRFCKVRFHILFCCFYTAAACLLTLLERRFSVPGAVSLLMEILLLSVWGAGMQKGHFRHALTVSAAAVSVVSVCGGITKLLSYWCIIMPRPTDILRYADTVRALSCAVLAASSLCYVLRAFDDEASIAPSVPLSLPAIPLFFISLVENLVESAIYGNTVIWDSKKGVVSPDFNPADLFFLQLCACCCLISVLLACKKAIKDNQVRAAAGYLKQQARMQENYLEQVQRRYEQTQAFRHDIRNHLSVLEELLKGGHAQQALRYLAETEEVSRTLSCPVHTGRTAVDALLAGKLEDAGHKGVSVDCGIKLPDAPPVTDLDWCIILSNAFDNAAAAACLISEGEKYIHIFDKRKGNLYFLCVENSCRTEIAKLPKPGIGLTNIKTVVQKYGGTMQLEVNRGIFRLNLLLFHLQQ